jgi:uncharacterized protein YjbI with pentapeptide repeats
MTNEELLALLKEGVETWNEWRRKNPDELIDLSQANLAQDDLNLANLSLANLSLANLSLTNLSLANLTQANLRWADLSQANLRWADLTYANLSLANLTQANLSQATLNHANLRWADLNQANLIGVELIGTDLSGANLSNTDFYKANLSNIDLTGIDLNGANLTEANLSGADLSGTDLRGANLTRANLENANFTNANLTGANLVKAKAWGANFAQATFTQACIEGWEVDRHTNLEGAIFDHLTPAVPEQAAPGQAAPEQAAPEIQVTEPETAAPQNNSIVGLSELESRLQSHLPNVAAARFPDLPQPTSSQEPSFDLDFHLEQVTPIDDVLAEVSFDPFAADEEDSSFFGLPDSKSLGDRDISSTAYNDEPVEPPSDMDASMVSRLPDLSFRFAPVPPPSPPIAPTASPVAASTPTYLELTFSHGINWQAFLLAFQTLQQQYSDRTFTIQVIAQEDDFPFVIRIKVVPLNPTSPTVGHDDLEAVAGSLYDTQLARIEAAYRANLRLTDQQIDTYRQQSTDLLGVVKQQAIRPIISVHMADEPSSQPEEQAIADALTAYEPPIVRNDDMEGWE